MKVESLDLKFSGAMDKQASFHITLQLHNQEDDSSYYVVFESCDNHLLSAVTRWLQSPRPRFIRLETDRVTSLPLTEVPAELPGEGADEESTPSPTIPENSWWRR